MAKSSVNANLSGYLLLSMFAHVLWSGLLYALLTVVRAPGVWGIGQAADGTNPFSGLEPQVSANLRNQFEWPVLFYAASIICLIELDSLEPLFVLLAWLFVSGRIAHSLVQILSKSVRLRGIVFTINFIAVLWMWALLIM